MLLPFSAVLSPSLVRNRCPPLGSMNWMLAQLLCDRRTCAARSVLTGRQALRRMTFLQLSRGAWGAPWLLRRQDSVTTVSMHPITSSPAERVSHACRCEPLRVLVACSDPICRQGKLEFLFPLPYGLQGGRLLQLPAATLRRSVPAACVHGRCASTSCQLHMQ